MITITIMGPTKSGKSYIAKRIERLLTSMEIATTMEDPSPLAAAINPAKSTYVFGGTVTIVVKSKAK